MREIRIPIIKVRSTDDNYEHIVGTDSHDQLLIENGAIRYLNIQCMCGTGAGYEFVGEENDWDGTVEVELVTLEEFAEIYAKEYKKQREGELELQKILKTVFEEHEKFGEMKKSEGYIPHT